MGPPFHHCWIRGCKFLFLPYYNWGDFVGFTWFTGMPLTALEMPLTALEEEIFLFFLFEANHFQTPGVSFPGGSTV